MSRLLALLALLAPLRATADGGPFNVRLEPAAALFLDEPQASEYGAGLGLALRAEVAPAPLYGIELGLSTLQFAPRDQPDGGAGYALTAGVRLRPLDDSTWDERAARGRMAGAGAGLWLGADGGLSATGGLWRPTFSAGAGLDVPIGRSVSLGPFLRYTHIVQSDSDPRPDDAQLALAGVAAVFAMGTPSAPAQPPPPPPPVAVAPPPDTDGDGLLDPVDRCPREPEDRDGFEDEDGCPDLDDDRDGIPDLADRCRLEPETANGWQDEDGCPDDAPARLEREQIVIRDQVNFEFARADLLPTAAPILDRVAELLGQHPEILKVRIEGHTDEIGTDAFNLRLSRQRAETVRRYVESRGVDPSRLTTVGHGRRRPLDESRTDDARARNRRVEFHVVERSEAPPL